MKQDESKLQTAIVKYLQYEGFFVVAVPNGGNRSASEGAKFKREGVMAGHSDLNIYFNKSVIFVELKTAKGVQSASQKGFQKKANSLGYKYLIWRHIDDAINWVNDL